MAKRFPAVVAGQEKTPDTLSHKAVFFFAPTVPLWVQEEGGTVFEPGQGECDTGGDGGAKGKAPAQDGTVRTSAQRVYKCHCRPPVRTRPTQGQGDESALAPPSRGAGGAFPKPTRRSRDMGCPSSAT